jgi:hypothetical protein
MLAAPFLPCVTVPIRRPHSTSPPSTPQPRGLLRATSPRCLPVLPPPHKDGNGYRLPMCLRVKTWLGEGTSTTLCLRVCSSTQWVKIHGHRKLVPCPLHPQTCSNLVTCRTPLTIYIRATPAEAPKTDPPISDLGAYPHFFVPLFCIYSSRSPYIKAPNSLNRH